MAHLCTACDSVKAIVDEVQRGDVLTEPRFSRLLQALPMYVEHAERHRVELTETRRALKASEDEVSRLTAPASGWGNPTRSTT